MGIGIQLATQLGITKSSSSSPQTVGRFTRDQGQARDGGNDGEDGAFHVRSICLKQIELQASTQPCLVMDDAPEIASLAPLEFPFANLFLDNLPPARPQHRHLLAVEVCRNRHRLLERP